MTLNVNNINLFLENDDKNYDKNEKEEDLCIDKLSEKILDLSNDVLYRIKLLEIYYEQKKEETIEIIIRLIGMYQMSGISILEQFLIKITQSKICILLRLEVIKSLLSYRELYDIIEEEDDDNEKNQKETDNELVSLRNNKRMLNSSKVLEELCSNSNILPTPCRLEAIYLLMDFEEYEDKVQIYYNDLINDQNIECDFRYNTILSLEKKSIQFMKKELTNIKNETFTLEIFNECSEITKKEFPNFNPNTDNEEYLKFLIKRINFDLSKKFYQKYVINKINIYEKIIYKAQLSFLFCDSNMTYYKILAGQYLLQKYDSIENKNDIENCILSFAQDIDLDYNLRADASDVLLQLGSPVMKENGRKIIMDLGSLYGKNKTIFENAQNVHIESIEKSVLEVIEFFVNLPTYMINDNPIDFNYVKIQIEDMLKFNNDDEIQEINTERDNKIKISLNRINMDRCLYSKYNNTLSNILIKIWSYLIGNEHEVEMKKRLLEELEDMAGTCSSGFASRLINTISGFGDFNIRISWEDQIISNFNGRLNMYARNITNKNSIFYKEKLNDVILLWLNNIEQINTKESIINLLNPDKCITENPSTSDLIEYFLQNNNDEQIDICVNAFYENVLYEMSVLSSNNVNRLNFSLFFRTFMPLIREELYNEFKFYINDTDFDLYMRKSLIHYDGN